VERPPTGAARADAAGRGCDGPSATGSPRLDRWTADPERGRLRTRRVDDRPQEFPRVREGLVARRHRYGCTATAAEMWRAYETEEDGYVLAYVHSPDRWVADA
jgi:carotenoid cleavage dioxygenase